MKSLMLSGAIIVAAGAAAFQGTRPNVSGKPTVNGETNAVTITVKDGIRTIQSNGIPDHIPGQFPNRGNPNSIRPVSHTYMVPVKPTVATTNGTGRGALFGVAINGIPFDPGTAEVWNNDFRFHYEALSGQLGGRLGTDESLAHVQPDGSYHYHGLPYALLKRLQYDKKMALVGWAADGYPIYAQYAYKKPSDPKSGLVKLKSSYRLRTGNRTDGPSGPFDGSFASDFAYDRTFGDLDEHNGRTGVTPEYPKGTYYYVLTETFPFVPRSFKGIPDRSFFRMPPGGGPGGLRGGGGLTPGPGGPGGPPVSANATSKFITIVRGRTVYIYSADGLKLLETRQLPTDHP
ncbi:MAG: YHYH protein [Armatimonadota bacterium]